MRKKHNLNSLYLYIRVAEDDYPVAWLSLVVALSIVAFVDAAVAVVCQNKIEFKTEIHQNHN